MKSTGIVRKLDNLRRIVIPIELCRSLNMGATDPVEIFVEGDCILLRKYAPYCVFCKESKDVLSFKGKNVCPHCVKHLKKL